MRGQEPSCGGGSLLESQAVTGIGSVQFSVVSNSAATAGAVPGANTVALEKGLRLVGVLTYDPSQEKYGLIVTEGRQADGTPYGSSGSLDEAELRILQMVADGLSCKHIARSLGTNIFEAGRRVRRTVKKLGANSRAAAVLHASREGLLDLAMLRRA
jgi:DNA-binding CsgD family transcriptional regulator